MTATDSPLIAINASPSVTSRTRALATLAVELAGRGEVVDLAHLPADALLGRSEHRDVRKVLDDIVAARSLVVATPVYRATYSGLLKVLFDQLETGALRGTGCVLVATAAAREHYLALDTGLRALVASLEGWSVPTVVYATHEDFESGGTPTAGVVARLSAAMEEVALVADADESQGT